MQRLRIAIALAAVGFASANAVRAQLFDSGFGQNKIAYERFDFRVYKSPHFDVHYYPEEEPFLEDIVAYAESAYDYLSRAFDHELRWRVPLIVYKTHAEFQQTNVQLSEIPESTLAFAEPLQNRMVLPIDFPPDFLYKVIVHELTHIFEFSMFFEGNLGRALRSQPPLWLFEGLASYMAQDETNLDRMVVRDAVVNNVLPPIEQLDVSSFFAYRYGHALFDYIEQEHGREGLRTFLSEYRQVLLTNNIGKAVKDAFGYELDELNRRFNRYLRRKYLPVLMEKKSPDDYGKEIAARKLRRGFTFSPALSPSGELVAVFSAPKLDLDLLILSAEDGSIVRNITKGWTNKYEHLVTRVFQGKRDIAWSPAGDEIAVFARRENKHKLLIFNALTGRRVRTLDFADIVQGASPAFSPDGRRIAFEGNLRGTVDIFEYNLDTGEVRNLTGDEHFDTNPWYAADGKTLLYNRRIGPYWKVFAVDLEDPERKTQITFGPSSDLQPSFSRDGKTIYFSSDRDANGVFNIYALDVATGEVRQYTDVVGGCFGPLETSPREERPQLVFTAFFEGSFRLYRMGLGEPERVVPAGEAVPGAVEIEPFEPPLRLSLDEDKKQSYQPRWSLDVPFVTVGVADDGTFLSNTFIQFGDLLGDRRFIILAQSVSSFSNTILSYVNLKHRTNWGASLFDLRDFFTRVGFAGREQIQRSTGGSFFVEHPFNRRYRVEGEVGLVDSSQDVLDRDSSGVFFFRRLSDRFGLFRVDFVGDTTRFLEFGPFQGKRFRVGAVWAPNLGGNVGEVVTPVLGSDPRGDILEFRLDFRTYKQLTRRSLIAWRLASVYNTGDRVNFYGFGGINQLRGFEFREFFGSRIAWSNLELRFPLVDELRFPFLGIQGIRGFLFFDVGAAWLPQDMFFDPRLASEVGLLVRADPRTGQIIPFRFWDSENDRLQDGRASYGFGFQFRFLGGLQLNWAWAEVLDYTQYVFDFDTQQLVATEADTSGRRMDFYIAFDF